MTDILWEEAVPGQTLLRELQDVVRYAASQAERSQQKALGPSEIGHPCARRLAFGLLEQPKINNDTDPLPSVTGTAVHTWFEHAIELDNQRLGRERWLSERRVKVRNGLSGKCDLFDTDTGTAVDLKNPGVTALNKYKKNDHPGQQYRVQLHTYGLGYANEGYDVKRVALFAMPRGGMLSDSWLWTEKFDPQIAHDALTRLDEIAMIAYDLDLDNHPERFALIPETAEFCEWCPWFTKTPVDTPHCCGGQNKKG